MRITIPDPDLGRCQNLRASRYQDGQFLRCLDYETVPHICTFPAEREPLASRGWSSSVTYEPPRPKRWVKPVIAP